jgi:hypothetical protein
LFQENGKTSVYENSNLVLSQENSESNEMMKQNEVIEQSSSSSKQKKQRKQPLRKEVDALNDELVFSKTVRKADGTRTYEYKCLLRDLGKPG